MENCKRRLAGILKNLKNVIIKRKRLLRLSIDVSVPDVELPTQEMGEEARKRALPNTDRPRERLIFNV